MTWPDYAAGITSALQAAEGPVDTVLSLRPSALHFIGNGASAAMASHMAADWTKTAGVPAMCYDSSPLMSALANDLGYEKVFSEALWVFARPTDTLVAISSSGESQNIIDGISLANARGCQVVTLTGFYPQNRVRWLGELNLYVPVASYGVVETVHAALLHAWLDQYVMTLPDSLRFD